MLPLQKVILYSDKVRDSEGNVKLEFHAKSPITGKMESIFHLTGDEDEWENFIRRIKKQLQGE